MDNVLSFNFPRSASAALCTKRKLTAFKIIYYVLNWKLGQEDTEAIRLIFEELRLESASLFSGYCVWDYVIVVEGWFD